MANESQFLSVVYQGTGRLLTYSMDTWELIEQFRVSDYHDPDSPIREFVWAESCGYIGVGPCYITASCYSGDLADDPALVVLDVSDDMEPVASLLTTVGGMGTLHSIDRTRRKISLVASKRLRYPDGSYDLHIRLAVTYLITLGEQGQWTVEEDVFQCVEDGATNEYGLACCTAFNPADDRMVLQETETITEFDTTTWAVLNTVTTPGYYSVDGHPEYSKDGRYYVTTGDRVYIYDTLNSWADVTDDVLPEDFISASDSTMEIFFSPNAAECVFINAWGGDAYTENYLVVFNTTTVPWTYKAQAFPWSGDLRTGWHSSGFSPDGVYFATGDESADYSFHILRTSDWTIIHSELADVNSFVDADGDTQTLGYVRGLIFAGTWSPACLGNDMNPAHIIHECLTNKLWGIGLEP